MFLVGCWVKNIDWRPSKTTTYFSFWLFVVVEFAAPSKETTSPHTLRPGNASSPTSTVMWKPSFVWLLCVLLIRQPPKAKAHHPSLLFDGSCLDTPNKGENAESANPTARALCTLIGEARRQDLGAPLPYQWRDRAKPLEGRVAAAVPHVGCCELFCVVSCDSSNLSYHPGSNTISANSKWPMFALSYHKIGPQTPQI